MQATIRLDTAPGRTFDHRAAPRMTIALPILIILSGTRHNALLRNISTGGAKIVTSAPLLLHMKIEFHCGAICAAGTVIWQRRSGSGIKFDNRICEVQLDKQIARANAMATDS